MKKDADLVVDRKILASNNKPDLVDRSFAQSMDAVAFAAAMKMKAAPSSRGKEEDYGTR